MWALERDFPSTPIITHSAASTPLSTPSDGRRRSGGAMRMHGEGWKASGSRPGRRGVAEMAIDGAIVMVHRRGCAPQIRWVLHRRNSSS